jgi:DNA mismatch repair protein MutS
MAELSNILHSATEESLVVLDEVGRGTATYDGISIAWAATEYLHNEVRAKTLFATHYHELTSLAEHLERVANVHVAVDDGGESVTFLRTIEEGPTDRSYGVHVAELAGVPGPVVSRADEVLARLRADEAIEARGSGGGGGGEPTQAVFDLSEGRFVDGERPGEVAAGDADGTDPAGDAGATDVGDSSAADGGRADTAATADAAAGGGSPASERRPELEAIAAELDDLDLNETSPIELMATVQEWQEQLDE